MLVVVEQIYNRVRVTYCGILGKLQYLKRTTKSEHKEACYAALPSNRLVYT